MKPYILIVVLVVFVVFSKKFRLILLALATLLAFGFVLTSTGLLSLGGEDIQTVTTSSMPAKEGGVAYVPAAPTVQAQVPQTKQHQPLEIKDIKRNGDIVVQQNGQTLVIPPTFGSWGKQQADK